MKDVTLLFLLRENDILLAMKKRGFGIGKWNGAGGKVEAGETIEQAVIRECQEEIGVTPISPKLCGDFEFRLSHDPSFGHHAHIYVATKWDGEPHETEEMRPQWFTFDAIPYDDMWADDREWLPLLLAGKRFTGKITIGPDDKVVSSAIQTL
jgi:mutator protein MutT